MLFPRPFLVSQGKGAAHVENDDGGGKDGKVRKGNWSRATGENLKMQVEDHDQKKEKNGDDEKEGRVKLRDE